MKNFQLVQLALAVTLLLASVALALYSANFLRTAKNTNGTITASNTRTHENGTLQHQPTFEFAVAGKKYAVTSRSFVSPSPGDIGDQVPVLYDPRNPLNARINSFVYNWGWSVVTLVAAALLWLGSLGIAWIQKRLPQFNKRGITMR